MAIIYRSPTGRARRRVVLVTAAVSIGVALAWLLRPGPPDPAPTPLPVAVPPAHAGVTPSVAAVDAGCDARCTAAKVIVPATTACAASVEELAGFGVRWLDADVGSTKFDRFAWLQAARGTVTLGGSRAEFRNAAGAGIPVEYDCDFDPATLVVLAARARPR